MASDPKAPTDLSDEVRALREEVSRLNSNRFFRLYESPVKIGLAQFARGLAFGFGSVLGATILVAVAVRMLGSIDFIPVIGEWAQQIIDQLEPAAGTTPEE